MYNPIHFSTDDNAWMCDFIRAHPLGLLITAGKDGICANPVPFFLAEDSGEIRLQCHLARANPQWRAIESGAEVRVVFSGPGHYISSEWYVSKAEHGRAVPTWNYVSVQASGEATVHHGAAWLRDHLGALTAAQESALAGRLPDHRTWTIEQAPAGFIDAQMQAIAGIELTHVTLNGKRKLSQNRSNEDRAGVVTHLRKLGHDAQQIARMMSKHAPTAENSG
ncbi:MAG: FMN-binding negative transcriptional regulator [Hyphomicrobiales bacterium]|nr:FMN-binding negative transcriptional regulator [Hyphomicrobiales bacterium]